MAFPLQTKHFDIIIIGSGGAGLMAANTAIENGAKSVAVISKVVPTSSHTVAAKGGINAALGNVEEDDWKWHAYDTIKGSDYLADEDAVEVLCSKAKAAILDLEKMGVVFSRDVSGKISQRAYGGQTTDFGKGKVAHRACYSKDKTGHTILHTLYQQALKNGVKFFSEFFVTDLLISKTTEESVTELGSPDLGGSSQSVSATMGVHNQSHGCLAVDLNSGELVTFRSKITILATGGYSQIYRNTTSSLICTGDGSALVFEEGLPLQDMEFVQFHPTGIFGHGFLVTEAARGEGGYLRNALGERFMEKYDAKMMELSSRDVIARAMATEILEGRGIPEIAGGEGKYLHLDLRHLSDEVLYDKLPGAIELIKNFTKLDAKKDLIPVSPSAHYTMGGIPTNIDGIVLNEEKEVAGLMAIGEAACVSVHGANRLGCNSLLDLVIFGKIAGKKAAEKIQQAVKRHHNSGQDEGCVNKLIDKKIQKLREIFCVEGRKSNPISLSSLKKELQENNEKNLGVFRNQQLLESGLARTQELFEIFCKYQISNKNLLWNDELVFYLELKNLFLNSLATNFSALNRLESRGSHYRHDFKNHDDKNFLCHSLVRAKLENDKFHLGIFSKKNIRKL